MDLWCGYDYVEDRFVHCQALELYFSEMDSFCDEIDELRKE